MEEIKSKKALIVNLSSIHELRYQATVMNKLCALDSNYPFSLPGHACDFAAGKYDKIISDYRMGLGNTDQFLTDMLNTANFNFDEKYFANININHSDYDGEKTKIKKELFGAIWNDFIQLEDETSCWCFFSSPKLSCEQKVRKLLDFAKNTHIDAIYFISNTNPLNVAKIVEYLYENFPDSINQNSNKSILDPKEDSSGEEVNIRISSNQSNIEIYLSLSYRFHQFKTECDNQGLKLIGTPGLLCTLCEMLGRDNVQNITLISQYDKDLLQAQKLRISQCHADEFYNAQNLRDQNLAIEKIDIDSEKIQLLQ